MIGVTQP